LPQCQLNGFLALARADQGTSADGAAVSLTDLVIAALAAREQRAAGLGLHLRHRLAAAGVTGNPTLLRRLVDNLLDNALRYNHPGGFVHVTCHADTGPAASARARLVVENTGPLLDDADVQQLGQPFRHPGADRTTTGSVGLGLSIVAAIAAAHHGTVHLSARPEGGLRAAVDLPCATRAAAPEVPR
jgi:signal transduction histidine kinase